MPVPVAFARSSGRLVLVSLESATTKSMPVSKDTRRRWFVLAPVLALATTWMAGVLLLLPHPQRLFGSVFVLIGISNAIFYKRGGRKAYGRSRAFSLTLGLPVRPLDWMGETGLQLLHLYIGLLFLIGGVVLLV